MLPGKYPSGDETRFPASRSPQINLRLKITWRYFQTGDLAIASAMLPIWGSQTMRTVYLEGILLLPAVPRFPSVEPHRLPCQGNGSLMRLRG